MLWLKELRPFFHEKDDQMNILREKGGEMKYYYKMTKSAKELYLFIVKEMSIINQTKTLFSINEDGVEDFRINWRTIELISNKLNSSCYNSVKRGKPNYVAPGYKDVCSQWSNGGMMKFDLMKNDKNTVKNFVILAIKWIKNGECKRDQPCFSRLNDEGNYEIGNIVIETISTNQKRKRFKSVSKSCTLIASLSESLFPEEVSIYESTSKAAREVISRLGLVCKPNTLQHKAIEGKTSRVKDIEGNTWNILLQTSDSKKPNNGATIGIKIGGLEYRPY